jgi:hypothetical protein
MLKRRLLGGMTRRSYLCKYMWQEQAAKKKVATQSGMKADKAKYTEVANEARYAKLAETANNNVGNTTCKVTIDKHLSSDTVLSANENNGKSEEVKELTKQTKKPEAAIDIVKEVTPAKLETIDD